MIFIALGAALLAAFSFMFLLFGLLLIATAVQLFRHRDQDPSVDHNALVTFARTRLLLTDDYHGGKLLTRVEDRHMFTPLFLVLIAIASSASSSCCTGAISRTTASPRSPPPPR